MRATFIFWLKARVCQLSSDSDGWSDPRPGCILDMRLGQMVPEEAGKTV